MIIYNEEKNLKRCLDSVKGFVDEIIAVDTGSSDNSKTILKEFGAQVFDFKWDNDFAAARNYSISKASGDYILFLDADEKLELNNPVRFKKYLYNNPIHLMPIKIVNFYGKRPKIQHCHFSGGLRLAKNSNSLCFINKIHEKIDTYGKIIDYATAWQHIRILHYGYMEYAYKEKKCRNLSLLLQQQNSHTDNAWTHYYLAAEYYRQGQLDDAYRQVNTSILYFLNKKLKPPSFAYKLKYDLLIVKHNYIDAYNGIIKAIMLYPDYVDLHFYKGILQYANGEYEDAKKTFSYCLILGEQNLNYLILSGVGSFLSLHYIGLCCQKLEQYEESIQAFHQADMLYPSLGKKLEFKHYLPS